MGITQFITLEAEPGMSQTSKMENFATRVFDLGSSTTVAKLSILDIYGDLPTPLNTVSLLN